MSTVVRIKNSCDKNRTKAKFSFSTILTLISQFSTRNLYLNWYFVTKYCHNKPKIYFQISILISEADPDDDADCGSINMSIQVNGIVYEGVLFAKIAEEGYLEAKMTKSPKSPKNSQPTQPEAAKSVSEENQSPKSPQ